MSNPRIASPPRTRMKVVIIGVVIALALTVFEVAVRRVTPDTVSYDVQEAINGTVVSSKSGTITDPTTIAKWRLEVTQHPSGRFLWQPGGNCAPLTTYTVDYAFLWHGVAVETASSFATCGDLGVVTRGYLPDPQLYVVPLLVQP